MNGDPDLFTATLKMLGALGVVLAGLGLIFWALKRFAGSRLPSGRGPHIRVLGSRYLGFKNQVTVVAVSGAVLVLGVSRERVNLLATLEEEEGVDEAPDGAAGGSSFLSQFSASRRRLKAEKEGHSAP